jgi:hypothetical protein
MSASKNPNIWLKTSSGRGKWLTWDSSTTERLFDREEISGLDISKKGGVKQHC